VADKVADVVKSAGGKVKQWTLDKLPKGFKGIFGKKIPKLPANATTKQKGNFGEMCSSDNMLNNPALKVGKDGKKYNLKRIGDDAPGGLDDIGHKGIDGIYENTTPPPKYIIDEAKFGSSQLGHTKDGKQMSDKWVEKRLYDAVGKEKADDIISNGYEKVLSQVDKNGNVTTKILDSKGNIAGQWP
jgi:hypothetical protein